VNSPDAVGVMPFVRYRTPDGWYAYDGPTNRILRLTPAQFDVVGLYHSHSKDGVNAALSSRHAVQEVDGAYEDIDGLVRERGVLTGHHLQRWESYSSVDCVKAELAAGTGMATLELTQNCNMRCAYCTYSGGYTSHRTHSGASMQWSTAKAAVDLLAERDTSFTGPFVSIGFYGGEPLLRFGLIRQVVEYAKAQPALTAHNLCFSMTTNATLLNDEAIRYLAGNNTTLLVSLDGPRAIHDGNRVFADGSPTFDVVMRNVRRVAELAPEFSRQRVSFSVTVAPDVDLFLLRDFLEDDVFQPYRLRVSYVAEGNPGYASAHPVNPDRQVQVQALFSEFMQRRIEGQTPSKLAVALFEPSFVRLHKRTVLQGPVARAAAGGACFPGGCKMYVSSDGTLHICEKMNPHFPIGHVHSGIDVDSVVRLLNQYEALMNREDCRACWAFRLCTTCFTTVGSGSSFEPPSATRCAAIRDAATHDLIAYCAAQEERPDVWRYLDDYTIS
jgi:uncharacterized protein